MTAPLMPKATAVWLLENTTLTFNQISEFCEIHILEIESLADGEGSILGFDPVSNGQLTLEEIELCMTDSSRKLALKGHLTQKERRTSGPKYTPLNKRHDKPDAVSWVIRNHPDLTDNQIIKLVGTTKSTIEKIRGRGHWNIQNIRPRSPVDLGICTQRDLDDLLSRNKAKQEHLAEKSEKKSKPKVVKKAPVKKAEPKKIAPKKAPAKAAVKKVAPKKLAAKKPPVKKAAPKKAVAKKATVKKPAAKKATPKAKAK
ncbi:MAG: cell cycle transcriptional regulator TrcR [Alphaproteobacteria bacterium]